MAEQDKDNASNISTRYSCSTRIMLVEQRRGVFLVQYNETTTISKNNFITTSSMHPAP
jgi:hypothetical protein